MLSKLKFKLPGAFIWTFYVAVTMVSASILCPAQSSDISFPTAVTENQITGQIKARDLGDARNTTYYFTFNGRQGDLFVNIVTKNLTGSVDIFSSEGMRPLTNILVYADLSQSETGRVIYLRKPEKLILRVQGRTPNDETAEFQIKFAGGFEAAVPAVDEPAAPKVTDLGKNSSGVRVNSVGTIIEIIPKVKPTPKAIQTETANGDTNNTEEKKSDETAAKPNDEKSATVETTKVEEKEPAEEKPAEILKPAEKPDTNIAAKPPGSKSQNRSRSTKTGSSQPAASVTTEIPKSDAPSVQKPPKVVVTETIPKAEPRPSPLANVNLVIVFKDGTKVQRPMTEVTRFTVDQTTLTVVSTNGRIAKFSILDVASVTIQ